VGREWNPCPQSRCKIIFIHRYTFGCITPNKAATPYNVRKHLKVSGLESIITFDNGQENRAHEEVQKSFNVQTYFCHPYRSWEKGSVEHAIGLTRRQWPKKTDYALLSDEEIAMFEYRLNTRPRKRFGYLTPLEYAASVAFTP
jgi:IS30 family transposase